AWAGPGMRASRSSGRRICAWRRERWGGSRAGWMSRRSSTGSSASSASGSSKEAPMTLRLRRVVTGHDEAGRSIVTTDELCQDPSVDRPGVESAVIWATAQVPADNMQKSDPAPGVTTTSLPRGTVFRVIDYQPGMAARHHRTSSIDYAVVLSGEIWMQL